MNKVLYHVPVLLKPVISALNVKADGIYVDGTLGGGGHSYEILSSEKGTRVIAIDRDTDALDFAANKLKKFGERVEYIHDNYKNIPQILNDLNIKEVDGILLDLGVSSYQLNKAERGFSFKRNGRLDMRMNTEDTLSAYDIVNTYDETRLAGIIFLYGEERLSRTISKEIIKARSVKPIETTFELSDIIQKSVTNFKEKQNVVQRTFQAIRIEVNDELNGIKNLLESVVNNVKIGGRIAVITFHSLEDRIVKTVFKDLCTDCICPPKLPVCVCNHRAKAKMITKKPITASDTELKENSRSAPAKLRVIERI